MKRILMFLALGVIALLPLVVRSIEKTKVEFSLLRVDRSDAKNPVAYFGFRQTAGWSLQVYGFGPPRNGQFHPRFIAYQVQTNGSWQSLPIGYCGTGAQTYRLGPGQSYTMKVELPEFTKLSDFSRVGITIAKPSATCWSEPFRLSDLKNSR